MMTNHIALYRLGSALRPKAGLALCLALCMLGLGHSGSAREHTIITIDALAGTGAGRGAIAFPINSLGLSRKLC